MRIFKYCLAWTLFFAVCAVAAETHHEHPGINLNIYAGLQNTNISPSAFTLDGNETETLVPHHKNSSDVSGGAGIAYRFLLENQLAFSHDLSLGLDVFYFQATQHGDTLDYGVLNNFNYQLKIKSLSLLFNAEWTFLPLASRFYPFIEGGMGVAYSSVAYYDTPNTQTFGGVGVNIPENTSSQFAYDIGAGLKMLLSENIEFSLRYLYSDLGTAVSSKHANLIIASPIHVPLKTQTWLLGLTYLI